MKKIIFLTALFFSTGACATTIQEIKTPGGFNVWLVEEHSQPLISLNIAFKSSGTAYDPSGKEGRAAMATAILAEGAGSMDSESFTRALESHAIRLSFSADSDNFYTSLGTLSENKDIAFSYLGLALLQARFDDHDFLRIKRQTLSAIKQQSEKPVYLLSRAWAQNLFGSHPYSKPELGTLASVEKLTRNDLKSFTQNYLSRSNIIISVVGDITKEELSTLLDKNLGGLPVSYKPDSKIEDIKLTNDYKQQVIELDIPQTIIQFGMEGLKRSDPEYITAYVMNYLLGGGTLTSKLNNEIREKRGLAYSVSTQLEPMQHAEIFSGGLATRNEKAAESIETLKQTLKQFAENGISETELDDAKHFLTGSFVVKLDSNSSIVGFLTMMQLQNLGIDYMDKRNNLIEAVTARQVNDMAKRLIKLDKLQIIMIGKPQLATKK